MLAAPWLRGCSPQVSLPLGSEAVRRNTFPSLFAPWLRGSLPQHFPSLFAPWLRGGSLQHFPVSLCPLAQRRFAATLPRLSLPAQRWFPPQHFPVSLCPLAQRRFTATLPCLSLPLGQHHHSHQSVLDDVSQTTERVVGSGSAIVQFPGKRSMTRKYEFR